MADAEHVFHEQVAFFLSEDSDLEKKHILKHLRQLLEKYGATQVYEQMSARDMLKIKLTALMVAVKNYDDKAVFLSDLFPVSSENLILGISEMKWFEENFIKAINWSVKYYNTCDGFNNDSDMRLGRFFTYSEPSHGDDSWFTKFINLKIPPTENLFIVQLPGSSQNHVGHFVTLTLKEIIELASSDTNQYLVRRTSLLEQAIKDKKWAIISALLDEMTVEQINKFKDKILYEAVLECDAFKSDDHRISLVKKIINLGANYLSIRWLENKKNIIHMSLNQSYLEWLLQLNHAKKLCTKTSDVILYANYAIKVSLTPYLLASLHENNAALKILEHYKCDYLPSSPALIVNNFLNILRTPFSGPSANIVSIFDPPELYEDFSIEDPKDNQKMRSDRAQRRFINTH